MSLLKAILILSLVSILVLNGYAQGCSDAGFCTMGAMKPDQPYDKNLKFQLLAVELGFYRGKTLLSPVVYVASADFNFSLNQKTFAQLKIPYQHISGNFGSTGDLSDISFSFTRIVKSAANYDLSVTLGGKIPMGDGDVRIDGRSVPMYYQPSLGTYDIVAGASLITRDWMFAVGYQQPFGTVNNSFTFDSQPEYPDQEYVQRSTIANELERGIDVMARVERNWRFAKFNINAGLLPIFRITKDEITDLDTGERVKLDGTTGLALSALIGAGYHLNVRNTIRIQQGFRLTNRKVNPDGLSRDIVTTISYVIRF